MKNAVYFAIFLHFARNTIRKISDSKYARPVRTCFRMEENGVKIYWDMYADKSYGVSMARRYMYTDDNKGNLKSPYDIVKDLVKNKYPSIMERK